jgi:hypothetical protein
VNKKVSNTTLTKKWYLMQIAVSNKKESKKKSISLSA